MRVRSMPKTEYDLEAIMYPTYATHHKLRSIGKNKTSLNPVYLPEKLTEYDDTTHSGTKPN